MYATFLSCLSSLRECSAPDRSLSLLPDSFSTVAVALALHTCFTALNARMTDLRHTGTWDRSHHNQLITIKVGYLLLNRGDGAP